MKYVYVKEIFPRYACEYEVMTISKAYSSRAKAIEDFNDDYEESLRCNSSTKRMNAYGDIIDMFAYETFSGKEVVYRLREIKLIN